MTVVTEVLPRTLESADPSTDDGRDWLQQRYAAPGETYVRLNMIATLNGDARGGDGTSGTITGGADRALVRIIRTQADVVVVGAASVRAEGYVVPKYAKFAIVTRTGDLGSHEIDPKLAAERVLIVCPDGPQGRRAVETAARIGATLVQIPGADDGTLDPRTIIAALVDLGLARVVCEGGPGLATAFAQTGMIDEYCVTVAPVLTDARAPFLRAAAPTSVSGMLVDDAGFSYLRLRPAE